MQLPSGVSFNAGTIIAYQYVLGPFNNATPYHDGSLMARLCKAVPGTKALLNQMTSLASVRRAT